MAKTVTDRDKIALQIQATIEWNFGQILDAVKVYDQACKQHSTVRCTPCMESIVRRHGNDAIRVSKQHLERYTVTLRPQDQHINVDRVVKKATAG